MTAAKQTKSAETTNLYDAKCYDLATWIIENEPEWAGTEDRRQELASHIQDEIENWLASNPATIMRGID